MPRRCPKHSWQCLFGSPKRFCSKSKDVKYSEYLKAEKVALKESEKIRKAIEVMDAKLKAVDISFFESNNLFSRYSERCVYSYR